MIGTIIGGLSPEHNFKLLYHYERIDVLCREYLIMVLDIQYHVHVRVETIMLRVSHYEVNYT